MKLLSVLIVDDCASARELLKSVIRGLGYKTVIQEASNGLEAIQCMQFNLFNIIFLDIEMPGMDGFEVLEKILAEIPNQFVVIVSANATLANVKKTIASGGKGFIVKPYTIEKLKGVVDKFFSKNRLTELKGHH